MFAEQALQISPTSHQRADLLQQAARAAQDALQYDRRLDYGREAVDVLRETGDATAEVVAMGILGEALGDMDLVPEMRALVAAMGERLGDSWDVLCSCLLRLRLGHPRLLRRRLRGIPGPRRPRAGGLRAIRGMGPVPSRDVDPSRGAAHPRTGLGVNGADARVAGGRRRGERPADRGHGTGRAARSQAEEWTEAFCAVPGGRGGRPARRSWRLRDDGLRQRGGVRRGDRRLATGRRVLAELAGPTWHFRERGRTPAARHRAAGGVPRGPVVLARATLDQRWPGLVPRTVQRFDACLAWPGPCGRPTDRRRPGGRLRGSHGRHRPGAVGDQQWDGQASGARREPPCGWGTQPGPGPR